MPDLTLIILSAGNSTRFGSQTKKQWLRIEDTPLWKFVAKRFTTHFTFKEVIITAGASELSYMQKQSDHRFVLGGDSRQSSLKNALFFVKTSHVLVTDVARACIPIKMVEDIINAYDKADIIVPYLSVSDTVVYQDETIDRDLVKLIQTPQLSKSKVLQKALVQDQLFTDDSSAIKSIGGSVFYTNGSINAKKITTYDDLKALECLNAPNERTFIGTGFDVHQFCENKKMYLGGIEIESKFGFKAHSDGDVALHALIDALLGAIGAGDIGELYPDSDAAFKDIDSKLMLKEVIKFVKEVGFEINNVDITIMAETPRLSSYKEKMRKTIGSILECEPIFVNVKATTTEKLGFIGRKEGVAVEAVASLKYYNWKKR
ncbi:MAG: bifunctional 2-C-methyl-D-erythritol 4-phosphate cytidylyltransferase/2-C-methyl-D-erythritol 2,4-cyclodiphosphate synthase [Epsilonproteobacteria bacterium]|nr:bifunctional 2-C-methyl-D-erythritol 4-phosphate cytidylyltransferase/2-C-methyl-D-erythritol 2,4-cyclodiphosphate synthase [Campylobacterota bacterium]